MLFTLMLMPCRHADISLMLMLFIFFLSSIIFTPFLRAFHLLIFFFCSLFDAATLMLLAAAFDAAIFAESFAAYADAFAISFLFAIPLMPLIFIISYFDYYPSRLLMIRFHFLFSPLSPAIFDADAFHYAMLLHADYFRLSRCFRISFIFSLPPAATRCR